MSKNIREAKHDYHLIWQQMNVIYIGLSVLIGDEEKEEDIKALFQPLINNAYRTGRKNSAKYKD